MLYSYFASRYSDGNLDSNAMNYESREGTASGSSETSNQLILFRTDYTPRESEEETDTLSKGSPGRVYKRRWYVLIVYCSVGFANYIAWNTWDPIQKSAKYVFGWNNGIISLLADWGLFTLIIFPPFYAALLKRHGLRTAELTTIGLMFIGAFLRVINWGFGLCNTIMLNISQFSTGAGGIIPMAGASLLSLTWFPEEERRFATSFAAGSQQIGLALSFLIGPLIVGDPPSSTSPEDEAEAKKKLAHEIDIYMWIQFAFVSMLATCVLVYFPSRPPSPPSMLSVSQRHYMGVSLKLIVKEVKFWALAFSYGFFSGIFNSYLAVIAIDLASNSSLNFSQYSCGWLGFSTTLIGAISGMLVAALADRLRARNPIRKMLLALLIIGFFAFGTFLLIAKNYIDIEPRFARNICIFVTVILTGCASASTVPLIFEIAADILYPIPEEVVGSMLVLVQNSCGLVLLMIFLIPGSGVAWLDYAVVGGIVATFPMVYLLDDTNVRAMASQFNPPNGAFGYDVLA